MSSPIKAILNANFVAWRNQYHSQSVVFNRAITSSIIWIFGITSFCWLSDLFITQNSNPNVLTTRNRLSILTIIGTVILVKLVVEGTIQIFYESEEQKEEAEEVLNEKNKNFDGKIQTNISKVKNYCKAEEYHQKYIEKNRG